MTRMLSTRRLTSIAVGVETLAANPLRTALSTLGIVMGSASLVAVLAMGDGLEQFVRSQIGRTTDLQSVSIAPLLTHQVDGVQFFRSDTIHFDVPLARSLLDSVPGVASATLALAGAAELDSLRPGAPRAAQVTAAWVHGPAGSDTVAIGRALTESETASDTALAVVSDTLARRLASDGNPSNVLGTSVRLNHTPFTIVGVLAPRPMGERPRIVVPWGTAMQAVALDLRPRFPVLIVESETVEGTTSMRQAIETRLAARYKDWKDRVRISSNAARLAQVRQGMLAFKMVMGAITGISLLVGGVGIMNVLLAAVTERTREIGIRKAVGARRKDILTQFLAESVAIAGAGSVLGLLIGLGGAFGISAIIRAQSQAEIYAGFAWSSVAVSGSAAILVGLAFGCYPALRAARLSPIDAIRHE